MSRILGLSPTRTGQSLAEFLADLPSMTQEATVAWGEANAGRFRRECQRVGGVFCSGKGIMA